MASWFDLRGTTLNTFSIGIKRTKFDSSNVTVQRSFILPDKNIDFSGGAVGQVIGIISASQIGWVSKQNTITGAATTINGTDLTALKALISNSSGKIETSSIDSSTLNFLSNVTSNIQTQINNKQNIITGAATTITFLNLDLSKALISNASGKIDTSSVSSSTIEFLSGLTSNPQTQISSKVESASNQGSGTAIFNQKLGTNLEFKSLIAGSNVTVSQNNNSITIDATYGGSSLQENNYTILDNQSNTTLETLTDKTRCYDINYSINRSIDGSKSSTARSYIVPPTLVGFLTLGSGQVRDIAFQNDGKVLIGGAISFLPDQRGNALMRFNSDGTEDTAFSEAVVYSSPQNYYFLNGGASTTAIVYGICIDQTNQKISIAGQFTNWKGFTGKNHVLQLNIDGTEDTTFMSNAVVNGVTPRFGGSVNSNHIQADGKVIIVGGFSAWNGSTNKNCLMRFNTNGTEDTTFTNNAVANGATARFGAGAISAVTSQTDGKILVGGNFTNWNAETGKSRLLRFNSNGTEDTTFTSNAVRTGTTAKIANNGVDAIKVLSTGKIIVGGSFTNYNAVVGTSYLIGLNSDGTLDTTFTNNASASTKFSARVYSVDEMSDGSIIVYGNFLSYGTAPIGQRPNRMVRLNADGTLYTLSSFNDYSANVVTNPHGNVSNNYVVKIKNDLIYVGGQFTQLYGGDYFGRLNGDGSNNPFFPSKTFGSVRSGSTFSSTRATQVAAIQSDGKILFGGNFTNFKGINSANSFGRLNADGTVDTNFMYNAVVSGVTVGSTPNLPVSRFAANIQDIKIQSDGKILIGGLFNDWSSALVGTGRSNLLRLNSDGTEDTAFSANAVVNGVTARFNGQVRSVAIQSDGKIIVGGSFTNWNGVTGKNRLLRLNSDGTEDTAFSANATDGGKFTGDVLDIKIQNNGQIIVAHQSINLNGVTGNNYVVRLNSNGTEDTTFRNNCVVNGVTARFSAQVNSICVQSDQKIIIVGQFTTWNGVTGNAYMMRFNSNGTEDTAFTANAIKTGSTAKFNNSINSVLELPYNNKLVVYGIYTNYDSISNLSSLIFLNSDGTKFTNLNNLILRSSFSIQVNSPFNALSYLSDGLFFIGQYNLAVGRTANFFNQSNYMGTFLDAQIRSQNGNILAIPTNTGFQFSSPSTTGSDADMPTGVTMAFNTDGTIKYSSNTLSLPDSAIKNIKIQKNLV